MQVKVQFFPTFRIFYAFFSTFRHSFAYKSNKKKVFIKTLLYKNSFQNKR